MSTSSASSSGKLLLVEDDPYVRVTMREMLELRGYKVVEASSGKAALGVVNSVKEIVLLLSDVNLPDMSGWELARQVALINSDVKLLLMSGYAEDVSERKQLPALKIGYLTKPFSVRMLSQKIAEMLAV